MRKTGPQIYCWMYVVCIRIHITSYMQYACMLFKCIYQNYYYNILLVQFVLGSAVYACLQHYIKNIRKTPFFHKLIKLRHNSLMHISYIIYIFFT